ncbi:MAG TPA: M18 family aminopeptidase, partial [Acidimicrobium sp.]|nr:M18 family aminopeptidase [Acidimicrobium sp.]
MTNQSISSITKQLNASPTPRHLVAYISEQLNSAGFVDFSKQSINQNKSGYIANSGSLIAWRTGTQTARSGFRIVGAHTDSPCLKLKPNPEDRRFGFNTLQVEIYGSPLINSWLDRDLGIAGHIVLQNGEQKLFCSANPVARISQLAIHLDREVNERGLVLDKQLHLSPTWSTDSKSPNLIDWVAIQTKTKTTDIAHLDAQLFDTNKATVIGIDDSLLASGRLDNQASCWAAITAIIESPTSSS